ncbi:MAG: pyridoxal-phosphate dependent enzyme, partial [Planctomycetes bacterium]|nr:pyridoxal-phosphate dependent enzyme [Planctomycetota bacterium]
MKNIFKNITNTIGHTPLVEINKLAPEKTTILAKIESFNPCGSIKDRIALSMIEDAEKKGLIKKDTTIIEPTSGNTGIGLACVCAVKEYKLILTMPES